MAHRGGGKPIKRPLFDKAGNVVGTVGIARDITERKRAEAERLEMERQLLHAQRLDSLGVLAGGVAHDYNNALQTIMGNLELTLLDTRLPDVDRPRLEAAMRTARQAADLTRQMLAYSGRGHFVVQDINLSRR